MNRHPVLVAPIFGAALFGCAVASGVEPARDTPLVLGPAVQKTVQGLLQSYRPPATTALASEHQQIYVHNALRSLRDVRSEFMRAESGLWTEKTATESLPSGERTTRHILSLCGLTVLVSASTNGENMIHDHVFVPYGIHSPFAHGIWLRAATLETTARSICSPTPGEAFMVQVELDAWIKQRNSTGGAIKQPRESVELSCAAAPESKPAAELNLPLKGDALLVTCDRRLGSGPKDALVYVFSREIGLYVLRNTGIPGDALSITTIFQSIQYR